MNIHFSIFAYQNSILPLRFTWNTALSLCHSYHVLIFYSLVLFSILECVFWFPKEMIFDGMDQNRLWKIFKEIGIPDNLTCLLRNLYADQEATVRTLKAVAPHPSPLAWETPWAEEPGGLQSMGSLRVGHDWATSLSLFTFLHWRRKWQPTSVFLPGESQGRGSLVGCHLWGRTESDTTQVT